MESSNVVYRYSRLSEVWTEFTEMITPRHDAGAVAVGENKIVLYWTTNIFLKRTNHSQILAKFFHGRSPSKSVKYATFGAILKNV